MTEINTLSIGQARVKPLAKRGKRGVRLRLLAGFIEKTEPGVQKANSEETGFKRRALKPERSRRVPTSSRGKRECLFNARRLKMPTSAEERQTVKVTVNEARATRAQRNECG
ncbi:hypothetical protein NDU88_006620 [Pleurodeles waltl]|uniref:Uncharacterized protein n=1 Tax=Pleurodeles waltl TaxID=8319 RepID=A0AAV7WE09_PLEWA|nr:hypothetical protein NDU88_006620 [Pleurodeles waltl]